MTTDFVKLTKNEIDLLAHRLEIADCIAEVLQADGIIHSLDTSEEAVEASAAKLLKMAKAKAINMDALDALDMAVLRDAMEGSTWVCSLYNIPEKYRYAAATRTAANLEEKFAPHFTNLSIPR